MNTRVSIAPELDKNSALSRNEFKLRASWALYLDSHPAGINWLVGKKLVVKSIQADGTIEAEEIQ